jgi:hypothetical protein
MKKLLSFLCLLIFFWSCTEKKQNEEVKTLQLIESPTTGVSAQPFLFSGEKTLLSWIENKGDTIYSLKYAELKDEKWEASKTIITGTNWFVNWADFPAITEQNGNILSHFLQMSDEGTYTYDIRMKLFNKLENVWKDDFILHNDGTKSEHGFVTMLPYKKDTFFITWLDGRNTAGGHDHDNHGGGAMTIRAATITSNGEIIDDVELDDKTCDCCQTTAAITKNGPIVIYRDRSDEEIRDIYISRLLDSAWTAPKSIFNDNWKISGCPVNGPKAVAIDNTLVVSWFTNADKQAKVKLIFSKDSGATFNEPIIIDETKPLGRVDVAMLDPENVLVSWITNIDTKTVIKAVKVHISGQKNDAILVAELDGSRASGFPQLEIVNDKALFAWTDVINGMTTIKTAKISLTDF